MVKINRGARPCRPWLARHPAHRDSTGIGSEIRPGDVQRMSAGSGIMHSECNASNEKPVHFLQIRILPDKKGLEQSYEQKTINREHKIGRLRLTASPDGRNGSVTINQDAYVYASVFEKDSSLPVSIAKDRYLWLQLVRGEFMLGDIKLSAGDGAAVSDETNITLTGR